MLCKRNLTGDAQIDSQLQRGSLNQAKALDVLNKN